MVTSNHPLRSGKGALYEGGVRIPMIVRFKEWKLIEFFEDGHLELYNLNDDPGEEFDLSEEFPGKAWELQQVLNNWREDVGAQLPTDNPGL